jgi:hypothetical protein
MATGTILHQRMLCFSNHLMSRSRLIWVARIAVPNTMRIVAIEMASIDSVMDASLKHATLLAV